MMKKIVELHTSLTGRWRLVITEEKFDRNHVKYLTDENGVVYTPLDSEGKAVELSFERK